MYVFFGLRAEDGEPAWNTLMHKIVHFGSFWWIQTHKDNISAVVGLSFNGAPLHGVYLS